MNRQFSPLDEIRKHPGMTGGLVAILAGVGIAALLLNQRTGPTRYERFRERLNPRGWFDSDDLRHRFDDLSDSVRHGFSDARERADDLTDEARHRSTRWFSDARHKSRKAMKKHGKTARRYAHDVGDYARDHAREGGAILALATIAAAIGAAALETRRPNSRIRKLGRF